MICIEGQVVFGTQNAAVTFLIFTDNFIITLCTACDKSSYIIFNDYPVLMAFPGTQHAVNEMRFPPKF